MNLIDEFGRGDHSENEARRAFVLTKEPTQVDYSFSNHVNYIISNIISNSAKNVSNYLTPDAKMTFDQLYQAFTEALILQHFDLEQYIRVETDASGHTIGGVLSEVTNDLVRWHSVAYFLDKMISAKT